MRPAPWVSCQETDGFGKGSFQRRLERIMDIAKLLTVDRVALNHQCASKKRVLETLGSLLTHDVPPLSPIDAFDILNARERLGSTAVGSGVAIPHGRADECPRAYGALLTLQHGIEFDAPDGEPVDVFFGLLVPANYTTEHLELLGQLARRLREPAFTVELRRARDPRELIDVVAEQGPPHAARLGS